METGKGKTGEMVMWVELGTSDPGLKRREKRKFGLTWG